MAVNGHVGENNEEGPGRRRRDQSHQKTHSFPLGQGQSHTFVLCISHITPQSADLSMVFDKAFNRISLSIPGSQSCLLEVGFQGKTAPCAGPVHPKEGCRPYYRIKL